MCMQMEAGHRHAHICDWCEGSCVHLRAVGAAFYGQQGWLAHCFRGRRLRPADGAGVEEAGNL